MQKPLGDRFFNFRNFWNRSSFFSLLSLVLSLFILSSCSKLFAKPYIKRVKILGNSSRHHPKSLYVLLITKNWITKMVLVNIYKICEEFWKMILISKEIKFMFLTFQSVKNLQKWENVFYMIYDIAENYFQSMVKGIFFLIWVCSKLQVILAIHTDGNICSITILLSI